MLLVHAAFFLLCIAYKAFSEYTEVGILMSSRDFPDLLALLEILIWILKMSQSGFIMVFLFYRPLCLPLSVFSFLVNSIISPYFLDIFLEDKCGNRWVL